jgi:hypothetical protein
MIMKFSEGRVGRVFVIRLEDDDVILNLWRDLLKKRR